MALGRTPPAFAAAGQQSGLQVWRVERLELVPVPPSRHGDFFVGDAYLVLRTVRRGAAAAYRLHYWLGRRRRRRRGSWGRGAAPGGGACPGLSLKVLAASPGSGGSGGGTFALPFQEACGREASELRRFVTEIGLQPRVWAMPSLAASDAAVLRGSGVVAERWTLACFVRLVWKGGEGWKSSLGCIQPGFTSELPPSSR